MKSGIGWSSWVRKGGVDSRSDVLEYGSVISPKEHDADAAVTVTVGPASLGGR